MEKRVLYISYNGLLEPILSSQVTPYLKNLSQYGFRFVLLTFEKRRDLIKTDRDSLNKIKNDLEKEKIYWKWLRYHKHPIRFSTLLDLLVGFLVSLYIVLKNNIEIIHVRGVTPGVIGLCLKKIFRKTKLIYDSRGILSVEYVGGGHWQQGSLFFSLVKLIEKKLNKCSDAIVVLTEKHYKRNLDLAYFKKEIPMVVIPCCVDLDRFRSDAINRKEYLKRFKINIENHLLFIYPGKLESYYLMKEMIDFFISASDLNRNLMFLVLTQDNSDLVRRVRLSISSDKVYFLHPSFEEIALFLRCADAGLFFINPYMKFASSPIKLGEFLASGKPVVINSGIGDTEGLVSSNRVGVVVRNFNKHEYLTKFKDLLELLKEGNNLKERCHKTAEKFLSLDKGLGLYKGIYSRVSA